MCQETKIEEANEESRSKAVKIAETLETTLEDFEADIWESKTLGQDCDDYCEATKKLLSELKEVLESDSTEEDLRTEHARNRDAELRAISDTLAEIVRDIPDAEMRNRVQKLADVLTLHKTDKTIKSTDLKIAML